MTEKDNNQYTLTDMKKSIVFIIVCALIFTGTDVFGQKVKKQKKVKQSTEQKETKDSKGSTETSRTPAVTTKTPVVNDNNAQPKEAKPVEIVNFGELLENTMPVITSKPNGSVNWTEQYIEAKGSSVIDYDRFPNAAQARAMATRGAIVVAQRNLLEIIQGVNVVSETTVKDMMVQNDYIYTRVDGVVKGAQQVGEAMEKDGMMEVTMRIPIYERNGLAPAVYDGIAGLPGMGNRSFPADISVDDVEIPSGLVFNFNGKQYDPSMFPMVVDQNGKLLLDLTKFYDPKEGKFPKILSGTKEIFNDLNFKEGTTVIDVIQSIDGKIVVDPSKTPKINWDKLQKGLSTATKIFKFILTII
jgi:hypothetical protein